MRAAKDDSKRFVKRVALLILAFVVLILSAASLLPLVPTEWWAARLLDFPRLPLAVVLVPAILGLVAILPSAPATAGALLVPAVTALAVHLWILWPYRPVGGEQVDACRAESRLSVLIANVQLGNRQAGSLLTAVRRTKPDLFLAMETDTWWEEALKPLAERMPYALRRITGSYYGIHLFLRLPLVAGEIRHLAGQDTPAVVTGVTLPSGEVINFIGVHPKPPQLLQSSLGRDAQLYAAAQVLRDRVEPGILAGDLNATPWEIAVARVRTLSGLIDPRRGYGYVATWNANSFWMRWPLDHIFHEGGFATLAIERLDAFGSDHFPHLVRLCRLPGKHGATPPSKDVSDVDATNSVLTAAGAAERLSRQRPSSQP